MPRLNFTPSRRPLPKQDAIGARHRLIAMVALAFGGFGIGVTEFVTMGLLNRIAESFAVSEAQAGTIITAYAFGVVIGAPLITAFTGAIPRRRLLLLLMVAFIVGNALSTFAVSYEVLVVARFIAGLPHGAYFSVSALSVASMAPAGQRGRYLAFVGMGLPVATVIGVPIAQALGQVFGWQAAYVLVTLIGVSTLVALWFVMPHMNRMLPTSPLAELGALRRAQVWLSLAIGAVGFGGMFAVYTYISWIMTQRAGLPSSWMWLVLMSYGLGMVAGNWFGGRLADWNVERGIGYALAGILCALLLFAFASQFPVVGTIGFGLVGFSGSTLVPGLQIRLMDVAGEAKTLAAALNHSALNIANAAGAWLGGAVIAVGWGYVAPAFAGAVLSCFGLLIWAFSAWLRRGE